MRPRFDDFRDRLVLDACRNPYVGMAASVVNHCGRRQNCGLAGVEIASVAGTDSDTARGLSKAMRRGDETFLQHIAECFRAGFKQMDAIESHLLKEPMPETPEVDSVAEATWSDGDQFAARP